MRIIGFGAHPDDVEIFFLGMLAAARAAGHEVGWVVATDGARWGAQGDPGTLRQTRRREAEAAAAVLGVTPLFLDRPDGSLATENEAAGLIGKAMIDLAPDLVITHDPSCYHPDHRALGRLVKDAASFRAPVLYADTLMGNGFAPTHYVDITDSFDLKRHAIRAHASQRPERFVAACETWNGFRALQCNGEPGRYAEAFRFEPSYPFADVRDLLPPAPPVRPLGLD